jgi:hypothetical protein
MDLTARTYKALIGLLLLCGVLAWPPQALPQQALKRPVGRIENPSKAFTKLPPNIPQRPFRSGDVPPAGVNTIVPYDPRPITMEFSLEWTTCQIHRVSTEGPIQALLSGTVNCSAAIVWSLTNTSQPGEPPVLFFVEDIFGRSGSAFGSNIPVTWEVALDGGAFQPMQIESGNILTTIFPAGAHTFQVRITGLPQNHQDDGYYHLQLTQNLMPQL